MHTLKKNQMPIVDEITISYKRNNDYKIKIRSSQDASSVARSVIGENIEYKEYFYVIAMNNSNQVLGVKKISSGGITGTMVDIRIIFQTLLKAHGTSFIIFHNHPSGTLVASNADKQITRKIKRASELLDIKLLDHIIVTKESYFSFADENML